MNKLLSTKKIYLLIQLVLLILLLENTYYLYFYIANSIPYISINSPQFIFNAGIRMIIWQVNFLILLFTYLKKKTDLFIVLLLIVNFFLGVTLLNTTLTCLMLVLFIYKRYKPSLI